MSRHSNPRLNGLGEIPHHSLSPSHTAALLSPRLGGGGEQTQPARHQWRATIDLWELSKCTPKKATVLPPELIKITTPLILSNWQRAMSGHPDRQFAEYITMGIQEGFRIGFQYGQHVCSPATGNMRSASEQPEVIEEYLGKEMAAGRILGPLDTTKLPGIQISPFGVIPK